MVAAVALTLTPDVADILTKLGAVLEECADRSCSRGQDGVPAVNWGGCGRREANWSVGACRRRDGEVVGWSGGLSSAGGLRGKVGRFWAKLGCFRGFFSRGTHAPPLWLSLGGPLLLPTAVIEMRRGWAGAGPVE